MNDNDELFPDTANNNQPAVHKTPRTDTWLIDAFRIKTEEDNAAAGERLFQIARDAETELYDTRERLKWMDKLIAAGEEVAKWGSGKVSDDMQTVLNDYYAHFGGCADK